MKVTSKNEPSQQKLLSRRKVSTSQDDRRSRDHSMDGHVNPLKIKSSFLRNSINSGTIDSQNQNHPYPLSSNIMKTDYTKQPFYTIHLDKKQDFKVQHVNRKQSTLQKSQKLCYQDPKHTLQQVLKDHEQIKFINLRNQKLFSSSNSLEKKSYQEKENKSYACSSFNESNSRILQLSTAQSVMLDSSLAQFRKNETQLSPICIIKDQMQLILKRLARNQCDIQSLKRNKSLDLHLEQVWKKLSTHENTLWEVSHERLAKFEDRINSFSEQFETIKLQHSIFNKKLDQDRLLMNHQLKEIERKISLTDQKMFFDRKDYKVLQNSLAKEIEKKIQKQFQFLLNKLEKQTEAKINTKLNCYKDISLAQKLIQGHKKITNFEEISEGKRFKSSYQKSHDCIALIYRQIIKVTKEKERNMSQFRENMQFSSDRSKLLATVFHSPKQKISQSRMQLTPIKPSQCAQETKQQNAGQIQISQVGYFIDKEGYLLDERQFYILDEQDEKIRLDEKMIKLLQQKNVIAGGQDMKQRI